MKSSPRSWKTLIGSIVERQPRLFELSSVMAHADELRSEYPANRFIEAKIRQTLQVLRDQGVLKFLGHGRYERLDERATFSVRFDSSLAAGYTNRAQIARVLIETWAEMNLYCLNCNADALARLPPNTPVADFECPLCRTTYQLKSKDGRFGDLLIGAAYEPTLRAVREGRMPAHILVEFDRRRSTVVYADALPGVLLDEDRILPRRRLSATARRSGWRGCIINVAGIPLVPIVQPEGTDRGSARDGWEALTMRPVRPEGQIGS